MYAEWMADTGVIAETGKHGQAFYPVMGVLLIMEYFFAKELSKAFSKPSKDE